MHSSTCDLEPPRLGGAEVFVAIAALVTEGRTPPPSPPSPKITTTTTTPSATAAAVAVSDKPGAAATPTAAKHRSSGGFSEGPHCTFSKASQGHVCNLDNLLCIKYDKIRSYVLSLWQKSLPLCIDVLLVPNCCCENDLVCNPSTSAQEPIGFAMLLEQWNINVLQKRSHDFSPNLNINQLMSAIRSQLYFSQISAWLASPDDKIRSSFQDKTIVYCLTVPGETFGCKTFAHNAQHHNFPTADLGNGIVVKVSLSNVPRTEEIPHIKCSKCDVPTIIINNTTNTNLNLNLNLNLNNLDSHISVLDDRMQMSCTLKGKHRCDDYDDFENNCGHHQRFKRNYLNLDTHHNNKTTNVESIASTSRNLYTNLSNLFMDTNTNNSSSTIPSTTTTTTISSCNSGNNHQGTSKSKLNDHNNKCDNNSGTSSSSTTTPPPKVDLELSRKEFVEVLSVLRQSVPMKSQNTKKHDLANKNQGDILLDAILRSSKVQSDNNLEEKTTTTNNDEIMKFDECSIDRHKRKGVTFLKSLYPRVCDDGDDDDDDGDVVVDDVNNINDEDVVNKDDDRMGMDDGDNNMCDNKNDSSSSIISDNNRSLGGNDNIYIDINCDNIKRKKTTDYIKMCDISNVFSLEYLQKRQKVKVKQKITFDDHNNQQHHNHHHSHHLNLQSTYETNNLLNDEKNENNHHQQQIKNNNTTITATNNIINSGTGIIPSALEQAKFRKSLDNAASMVFHSRTGLPLTSSPAPVRRGKSCFDFDSSINSVSAIRSALFSLASCSTDEDSESDCSIVSPCSPETTNGLKQREIPLSNYRHRGQSSGLLGSFVESVLNGRLEPVSTVHGFSAELGASGSFCPRHVVLPVTVFFYTLGDNDKVSTPYLGHINLGKKGYNVPKSGTIQVTLFNPLGTVVKMFVIMYDLSDMPPNSQTFIRQRTLFMPANCQDENLEWSQKWLRYLIHLRFMSSKSGRIYLHSDIRMIICRKSDLDTATAHGIDMSYELRSFINSPTNPRFSPRK